MECVCVSVSISHSLHHLRPPVCDLMSHMDFLPKYTFTILLCSEKQRSAEDEGRCNDKRAERRRKKTEGLEGDKK